MLEDGVRAMLVASTRTEKTVAEFKPPRDWERILCGSKGRDSWQDRWPMALGQPDF